jgi:hypothetical protein
MIIYDKNFFVKVIFIIVVICCVIYFGLNELYKLDCGYTTVWSAETVLDFFGTLLGSVATVFALFVTIDYTNQANKAEQEYQNKRLLADYKDENMKEKFDLFFDQLNEIKNTIMLHVLENETLINKFTNKSIDIIIENLKAASHICNREMNGKNRDDKDGYFWKYNLGIIGEISSFYTIFNKRTIYMG